MKLKEWDMSEEKKKEGWQDKLENNTLNSILSKNIRLK